MWQNFQMLQCFQMLQILLRPKECYKLSNVADIAEFSRMLRMLLGLKKKKNYYYNVADPAICCGCGRVVYKKGGLPNVAKSLKNVANDAQPTKIV